MNKIHACGDPTGEFSGNGLRDPSLLQLVWNNVSHTMPEDDMQPYHTRSDVTKAT